MILFHIYIYIYTYSLYSFRSILSKFIIYEKALYSIKLKYLYIYIRLKKKNIWKSMIL